MQFPQYSAYNLSKKLNVFKKQIAKGPPEFITQTIDQALNDRVRNFGYLNSAHKEF